MIGVVTNVWVDSHPARGDYQSVEFIYGHVLESDAVAGIWADKTEATAAAEQKHSLNHIN
jgi:hypothetical protein